MVYKVDRLTRSLADFAKMVEVFDARGVSFVAVTQQFNTTTRCTFGRSSVAARPDRLGTKFRHDNETKKTASTTETRAKAELRKLSTL